MEHTLTQCKCSMSISSVVGDLKQRFIVISDTAYLTLGNMRLYITTCKSTVGTAYSPHSRNTI